ncbi:MAG: PhoH family protein, partial [Lysobacteraceae bacterium]
GIVVAQRGGVFRLSGDPDILPRAEKVIRQLYDDTENEALDPHKVHLHLNEAGVGALAAEKAEQAQEVAIRVKRGTVRGRGPNQVSYLHAIAINDINFGIGPAGTGKTFLAVASAVEALNAARVQRLVLVRPAVEAGEKLGFLPGDLSQKVDPYLRPLYDALYEMLGVEKVQKLIERNVIEIAPLAYMRGRTLNDAFVILDEAQNTTIEQMKMFLTRIGFGSTAVITGDLTQVDLPRGQKSGLRDAIEVLKGVDGLSFTLFTAQDVVRHPLVARIVRAYEARDGDG